jgi:hypothetical protein
LVTLQPEGAERILNIDLATPFIAGVLIVLSQNAVVREAVEADVFLP